MRLPFALLLVALPLYAQDSGLPPLPGIGIVEKLDGQKGQAASVGSRSEVAVDALGMLEAAQIQSASDSGVAPLTSMEQLLAIDDYLRALGAQDPDHTAANIYTIERLSNRSLVRLIRASERPDAPDWLKRMATLARMEAATRGLDVLKIIDRPLGEAAPPQPAAQPAPAEGGGATSPPMQASESDVEILARIVKGEVPETAPFEGAVAVAAVVLNRVRAGYGPTIEAVAHAPWQFSCYNPDVRNRLYWGPIPDFAWRAARAALAGENPVPGCTNYFNPYLVQPSWAASMHFYRRIGTTASTTHVFYRP